MNKSKLKKSSILISNTDDMRDIPFCMCCDYTDFVAKTITMGHGKKGRLMLGCIPICVRCETECSPEGETCTVDEEHGRKITMNEVMKYIMG